MVIVLIVLSLFLPAPAQAFLNRDCPNLKKRVNANQVKYEKVWDKYQTALGKYKARGSRYGANVEVANRLRVTYTAIEVILLDMYKYPKCVRPSSNVIFKNYIDIRKKKSEYESFMYTAPLPDIFDFRTYLK
jgi:hypothetical protein